MSGLLDAIHVEITRRETRRVTLADELGLLDSQLDQLRGMVDLAASLNGAGTVEEPAPGKTSKRVSTGGRSFSPGRNGGKAPARRAKAPAGSAPSGTQARAAGTNGEGGGKRAAVLAFVQANGRVKIAQVAEALGVAPAAAAAHLKKLRATGEVLAEGSTANRVYFAAGAVTPHEAPPSPAPEAAPDEPVDENYLDLALTRQLGKGPLTPAAAAGAIDAPLAAVTAACARLSRKGSLSRLEDGTYVA